MVNRYWLIVIGYWLIANRYWLIVNSLIVFDGLEFRNH